MKMNSSDYYQEYVRYKSLYKELQGRVMHGGGPRKRTTDTLGQLFKRVVSYGYAMHMKEVDAKVAWQ